LTDSDTDIRGFTQTTSVGNTNPSVVGTGGTVGVDMVTLPTYAGPEIAIDANDFEAIRITGGASNILIEGIAIYGSASAIPLHCGVNQAELHAIIGSGTGTNRTITHMLLGMMPNGADPLTDTDPASQRNGGFGARAVDTSHLTVSESYIGYNGQGGVDGGQSSTVLRVLFNEVFRNGWNSCDHDGIDLNGVNGSAIGNLVYENTSAATARTNRGNGIELGSQAAGTGVNLVENNTSINNQAAGVSIRRGASSDTVRKNILTGNTVGISVATENRLPTNANTLSENSIFANAGLGIDLNGDNSACGNTDVGCPSTSFDGVTLNDQSDPDIGSNDLTNFPLVDNAVISGGSLTVTGFAEPGSRIEFFIADPDPTGFGEGKSFLFARTEGSIDDTDAGTGTYGPVFASLTVSTGPVTTNRFSFTVPTPAGVTNGTILTTTSTVADSTSEFGPTARVVVPSVGPEGCTPGYWKNNAAKKNAVSWGPTGLSPSQSVASVFTRAGASPYTSLGSKSLLQGLSFQGGSTLAQKAEILLRAAVAAALNAASPNVNYPLTLSQVQTEVNNALNSQNGDTILAEASRLDGFNNLGCPINQQGQRTA